MTLVKNGFESGTNGATPDGTNTADPDAFTNFAATGISFSNAQKHKGSLALDVNVASGANNYVSWQAVAGSSASGGFAFRGYVYIPTLPTSSAQPLFNFRSSGGGTSLIQVQLDTTGAGSDIFATSDANAGANVGNTNFALSAATWYRISLWGTNATSTTGTLSCRVYSAATETQVASFDSTGINIGTSAVGTVRMGRTAGIGSAFRYYLDDVAFQTGSTTEIPAELLSLNKMFLGSAGVDGLKVGTSDVAKAYLGTTQVW